MTVFVRFLIIYGSKSIMLLALIKWNSHSAVADDDECENENDPRNWI